MRRRLANVAVFDFFFRRKRWLFDFGRVRLAIFVHCAFGKRDRLKSSRECIHNYELDVEALLWTRGPNFLIERLASRLMCPRCNSRKVRVEVFTPLNGRQIAVIGPGVVGTQWPT